MTNQSDILRPSPPQPLQQIIPYFPQLSSNYHQTPKKKKRSKVLCIDNQPAARPKKPDAKITPPCTECGKKFWSWKALFGHMRCHPERNWRGINPPPNLRRPETGFDMTDEEHEVASCLLMLANGSGPDFPGGLMVISPTNNCCSDYEFSTKFECSSCKKVFGSHQALGGHRASHKNVKGCFAIHRGGDVADMMIENEEKDNINNNTNLMMSLGFGGHKCGICMRVFSSGQALGGHKRSHFEKGLNCLDLNLPAPIEDCYNVDDDPFDSSCLALDLRLGI